MEDDIKAVRDAVPPAQPVQPAPQLQPALHRQRFASRRAAGQELAQVLRRTAWPHPVVLALPRGGVPVAAEVARALGAPLDLLMVRKIGAPGQPELAVAAMAWLGAGPAAVSTDSPDEPGPPPQTFVDAALLAATGADQVHVDRGVAREGPELARRRKRYLQGRHPVALDGCTVILVDDGIATGTTMRAALQALRRHGVAHTVLAVPVAPHDTLMRLAGQADRVVCLAEPPGFRSVGEHYAEFPQVDDDEVVAALRAAARPLA
jgi:putative phosphoribosyl transferase